MLRILRKATASSSKSRRSISDVVVDDLSAWEFVDLSQSDDDDLFSFDGDDVVSDETVEGGADEEEEEEEEEGAPDAHDSSVPDDVMSLQSLSVSPPVAFPVEVTRHLALFDDGHGYDDDDSVRRDDDDDEEEEEEEDVYADDVDDELVPWKLKGKFGKQRIRKMGKRGGPKVNKSKRLPYVYNRPGCLYGKHGLGVQHSYI